MGGSFESVRMWAMWLKEELGPEERGLEVAKDLLVSPERPSIFIHHARLYHRIINISMAKFGEEIKNIRVLVRFASDLLQISGTLLSFTHVTLSRCHTRRVPSKAPHVPVGLHSPKTLLRNLEEESTGVR
jgi:hypothetical protein